jgi:hypothetical protein
MQVIGELVSGVTDDEEAAGSERGIGVDKDMSVDGIGVDKGMSVDGIGVDKDMSVDDNAGRTGVGGDESGATE